MFKDDGSFAKPETEAFLRKVLTTFAAWVGKHKG
jgi:chromate reductase, NAD(P)H dehydrogenase (quinone)